MRTEKELDFLEQSIPVLANSAITKAYYSALSSGASVLEVISNKLYEVFPDGTKKFIKDIPADIKLDTKVISI